jgi:uncharacterized protein (DUF488 family)
MNKPATKIIYTIGHSTRSEAEFLAMLKSFGINIVVDIRRLPGSRKYPQFDMDNLKISLEENHMQYIYLADLGGRRKAQKDSKNNRWKNPSFRAYADYMETDSFKNAASELEQLASKKPTAIMCSEAVWWRCHRSMVADYLKVKGWAVLHIMALEKAQEHPYTQPATIVDGQVCYSDDQ